MRGLDGLNAAQRDAVTTLAGPLLVLAGAGTGKTRVITHRMAELIRSGVAPDRILSVTFTNKAAKEMQERTRALLGQRLKKKPLVSTFHSLCVKILRQEIAALGYPADFAIYDRGDQESVARTALRDVRVAEAAMRPGDLLHRISRWKMEGVLPSEAAEHTDDDLGFLASVAYRRYQATLRSRGALDFDDLLLLTGELFDTFPEALARQQSRFDHVQIDEYQDTNGVQFDLVQSLVESHRNLCVVGDDDQSIYGWRGADVAHILGFQSHFPDAKVVRLEDNYRCTAAILDLANRLVRHNRGRHEKVLEAHKVSADEVRFLEYPDEQTEAESVVREIDFLIKAKGVAPGEIAVLFRTNEQPRLFETELRRKRVRYVLIGGQSFFDRKEIRDVLAYLKAIAHPADEVSLLRIINTPARGIGESTVERLLARAVQAGVPLWDVLPQAASAGDLSHKAAAALEDFRALLDGYRRLFDQAPDRMADTLARLIEDVGYEAEIEKQYKEPAQQLVRIGMLEQMVEAVRDYAARSDRPALAGFLEETALGGREEESDREERLNEDGIKLMTLHSAKGLEFPRVYLVGLEEGLLPHRRSVEDGSETAIAEERRLTYVGITRAMDHLTITRAATRMKWGRRRQSVPSRFLYEMRGEPVATAAVTEREPEVGSEAGRQ
ncbi:MAG: UvrD-helicase domain-containing protein [Planctomycetales bacterium]